MTFSTINNRELATYIWTFVFIIFCLSIPSIRSGIPGLLKSLLSKHILIPILLMIAYVVMVVYIMYIVHFWDINLLKTTIVWLLGIGFVMLFNANKAIDDGSHFKEILKKKIKLTIIMEFIINFYVFSLPVELFLVPVSTLLVLLQLVSGRDKKNQIVTKFLTSVLTVFGLIMVLFAGYKLITNFKEFSSIDNLKDFLFPILMTLLYIPFVYLLVLFMIYEVFFIQINLAFRHDELLGKYARKRIFATGRLNLSKVRILKKELHLFNVNTREGIDEALVKIN